MGWGVGWTEAASGANGGYLMARGLAAWALSVQTGLTPERCDQIIGDEVVGWSRITPASFANIMTSAHERALKEKGISE